MAKHKYIETPEEWKPIEGYEGYEVSNKGRVRSYRKRNSTKFYEVPKIMRLKKCQTHCKEYLSASLMNNGKKESPSVHRLVAKAFIDNPENKPQVHHIDNNEQNNCVENLQWVTNSENQLARKDWSRPSGYKYVFRNRKKWRAANIRLVFDKCFKTRKVAVAFAMQYY